jgi:predicted phosphoribosyltransferase
VRVHNDAGVRMLAIQPAVIDEVEARERRELERRERLYRAGRPAPELRGRTVILVDDGLATGSTMRAAVRGLRALGPARIVVAVPTAAAETCDELRQEADEVVCASTPRPFRAVGRWYEDFAQTGDDEVRALLQRARHAAPRAA